MNIQELRNLLEQAKKLDKDEPVWAKPEVCFIAGNYDLQTIGIYQPRNGMHIDYTAFENAVLTDGLMLSPSWDEKGVPNGHESGKLRGGTAIGDYIHYLFNKREFIIHAPRTFRGKVRRALHPADHGWTEVEGHGTNPSYSWTMNLGLVEGYFKLIEDHLKKVQVKKVAQS